MTISAYSFFGVEDYCSLNQNSKCFVVIIINIASWSFGCLPIIFIGDAAWSAFKEKRHWIPAGSLVVGALVIQFLSLLDNSFNFPGDVFTANQESQIKGFFKDYDNEIPKSQNIDDHYHIFLILYSNWVSVLCGRVAMFVLMGCLLPGVARPLSVNLWRDIAALFISSSVSLFHISYETFRIAKLAFGLLFSFNLAMLVSLVVLLLLLVFAALATVSIRKTWYHKIPTMILVQNLSTEVVWEKVEERAIRSVIVARTGDPQYMMARSILTSSIAFVVTICNGILVFEICRFSYMGLADTFLDMWFVLRCVVIVMGSIIIYWRCITAVVFYPKPRAKFFQIEEFWKTHLLQLIDSFNTGYGGRSGNTSLGISIMSLVCIQNMRLHKLLYVFHYLEMFCIFLSKICWSLTQVFFSKIIGSAYNKCRSRKRLGKDTLGKSTSDFPKYSKSLVVMEGENQEAIWLANRKSVQEIKEEMKKEDEEGKNCTELISLLGNNSSPDFCGESCAKLQVCHHTIIEVEGGLDVDVESELNVGKHSWKMTTVSIIAVIVELSTYIEDQANAEHLVNSVMKACSQAWSMMDVMEVSDGEAVEVSEAANDVFHSLVGKEHKWLDWCLPISMPTERTLTEAKKAMEGLIEKGKEKAMEGLIEKGKEKAMEGLIEKGKEKAMNGPYENGKNKLSHNRNRKTDTRKWSERVAGYNMYKLGVQYVNYQFPNVEAILNKLKGMLADVIRSCMVKVVGVIMEDFKKQASLYDEESILRLAGIAGKVKGVSESLGWNLKWTTDEDTQSFKTSPVKDEVPAMKRRATSQMG